jgi:hypothetical protein
MIQRIGASIDFGICKGSWNKFSTDTKPRVYCTTFSVNKSGKHGNMGAYKFVKNLLSCGQLNNAN